jgi:hypothetical protein
MKATLVVQGANEQSAQAGTGSPATLKWSHPRTPEEFHPILVNFTAALLPTRSVERHPWSHLPTAVFSQRGLVDVVVCRRDHSIYRCGRMVVETDAGLCVASKANYRASMVGNRGSGAARLTRDLALEYSQARRGAELPLYHACRDCRPRSRVSRKFAWQNGLREVT